MVKYIVAIKLNIKKLKGDIYEKIILFTTYTNTWVRANIL